MKILYFIVGLFSVILGVIGIFLPVLPTTPFLLLATAMFFRSSNRAYDWLINHKYLGPYIKSFREDKSISMRVKVIAVTTLWLTAMHCIFFVFDHLLLKISMAVLATCISAYILSFKTRKG